MLTTIVSGDVNNDNKIYILFSADSYILGVVLGNGDDFFEVQFVFLHSLLILYNYQFLLILIMIHTWILL